jgi:peptide/nickel transport system permease protein
VAPIGATFIIVYLIENLGGFFAVFAYITRRLGILLLILFGSSFILYNLTALSGDPTEGLRMSKDPKDKVQLLALIKELDLNTPPPIRYFKWLKGIGGVFTGHINFGTTRDGRSVLTQLSGAIPTTFKLVITATVLAIILGIMLGIATALRQYSRFDYVVTFFSFLLFSLPIFWVAVLLKQFLAIEFNNFLTAGTISSVWIASASFIAGFFWTGVIGGNRKKLIRIFVMSTTAHAVVLIYFSLSHWFLKPQLGPAVIFVMSAGIAVLVTTLSTGLSMKPARNASFAMAGLTLVVYYPVQFVFNHNFSILYLIGLLVLEIFTSVVVGLAFAKIDRGPVVRTSVIAGLVMSLLLILDRIFQSFPEYLTQDGVNGRPIPTLGQASLLLQSHDYWLQLTDTIVHLILPTLALLLISFAGYIRFARGTMLEVLNQDYIRTARAKGLSERTVIMRHAFRNTLIPISTIIVVDLAGVIGGAIITERVFGWHAMGTLFNVALTSFDLNLLMGVFFVTASLSVLANLVADLLYSVLDPRVRVVGKK